MPISRTSFSERAAMLDTIVLLLERCMFQIVAPKKFTPSAGWVLNNTGYGHGLLSRQNPTKKELRQGIYKPRLTLCTKRNPFGQNKILLKIEFSAPKLLFGNNFEELQYKDRMPVIMQLVGALEQMGIITTAETIANAPVSALLRQGYGGDADSIIQKTSH